MNSELAQIIVPDEYQYLADRVTDIAGSQLELSYIEKSGTQDYQSNFLINGFQTYEIPAEIIPELWKFFDGRNMVLFDVGDYGNDYFGSKLDQPTVDRLNAENVYFSAPEISAQHALQSYLNSIASDIETQIASNWKVINVRAWQAKPNVSFGPSSWHIDQGPRYIRKLMLYLNPASVENGTMELFDRAGTMHTVQSSHATCVLCDTAMLLHRGLTSKTHHRPAIEVTIESSDQTKVEFVYAGQNARARRIVSADLVNAHIDAKKVHPVAAGLPTNDIVKNYGGCLNIGGGPNFSYPGWINLDGVPSEVNPVAFSISDDCVFPIATKSLQLGYSSHCLEHLNDDTVERVLTEMNRVLRPGGWLLLKLPDFEKTLEQWRENDPAFFELWDLASVSPTWPNKGIRDNLTTRAAMIFCGFWNQEYGEHFSGNNSKKANGSYHGPSTLQEEEMESLFQTRTPHEIAQAMVAHVRATEPSYVFNHQNAWSKNELTQLLEKTGFCVESFDYETIVSTIGEIPTIKEMKNMSIYCLATSVRQ